MLKKLWSDEQGIVALEYLLAATIVGLGLIVGFVAVKNSLVAEYAELGNAITGLSQAYSFDGLTWMGCASTNGSTVTDADEKNTTTSPTDAAVSDASLAACP